MKDKIKEKLDHLEQVDKKLLPYGLGHQEAKVAFLLACGYRAKDIVGLNYVSLPTVKHQTHVIYNKCTVSSKEALARKLLDANFIDIDLLFCMAE